MHHLSPRKHSYAISVVVFPKMVFGCSKLKGIHTPPASKLQMYYIPYHNSESPSSSIFMAVMMLYQTTMRQLVIHFIQLELLGVASVATKTVSAMTLPAKL